MARISKFFVFLVIICYYLNAFYAFQDVSFNLYKVEHPQESTRIESGKLFCHKHYRIDKFSKVFIIIHGWLQSINEQYVKEIRKLLFRRRKKQVVVIEVDWSSLAKKDYDEARSYNQVVGNATSDVLSCLVEDFKFPHANIEIICHCMGCHIAAVAGKNVFACTGKKIGRITALDPSGPGYLHANQSQRLGPNDANMVFVIHTDAFMFGFGKQCGTIDFYPNGGRHPQPGCPDKKGVVEYDMCSHQRSILFYMESLNHSNICGIKCPSYSDYKRGFCSSNLKVNFAKPLKRENSGTYFSTTNSRKP